jgi:phosphatidylglycerol:prolipoprotein diacylglycerol transferase
VIPYIVQPQLHVLGVTIYAFGAFATIAVLVGWWAVVTRARTFALDPVKTELLTSRMLFAGLYGSHVVYLLVHAPGDIFRKPWTLLNPLTGLYSFGGIVVGLTASIWCARYQGFTLLELRQYLDCVGFVFPFVWGIARMGCALAHDHVGVSSNNWVAVRFPQGSSLDLGLIEALFACALAMLFLFLDRFMWPPPFFCGLALICEGLFRVHLDTLQVHHFVADRVLGWTCFGAGFAALIFAWWPSHHHALRTSSVSRDSPFQRVDGTRSASALGARRPAKCVIR